jgi:hypothetical protein
MLDAVAFTGENHDGVQTWTIFAAFLLLSFSAGAMPVSPPPLFTLADWLQQMCSGRTLLAEAVGHGRLRHSSPAFPPPLALPRYIIVLDLAVR